MLGDRHGISCSPLLSAFIEEAFTSLGYSVARNSPYAGGYCTVNYGKPSKGIHAIQIEINRALYMNEALLKPDMPSFEKLQDDLGFVIGRLASLNLGTSRKLAAE